MRASGRFTSGFAMAALTAAVLAVGCGATPTEPTPASPPGALAGVPGLGGGIEVLSTGVTPADLTRRGWECRVPPPYPDRIVCRAPNQSFPSPTVPVDQRPPTFTTLVFQNTGAFIGTLIGIRADLYQGQICGPTGEPYIFRPPIGYYECLHPAGR
jgi:hypothetical protein